MNYVVLARKPYQSDHECEYLSTFVTKEDAERFQVKSARIFRVSNRQGFVSVDVVMEDGSSSGVPQYLI